ncbi:hypothetical protein C942_04905 [Photobacterium marinum]|uniref:EamA domain-containing protein n=1 Tax=Photobacterium marinum TaxID=1056511 RepID=L8JDB6_9GAMM|nr:DMT family transporter [Photobacterium marinum]ELR66243.1 hypothetical protein C942_04905 [Photobacterium marinum]
MSQGSQNHIKAGICYILTFNLLSGIQGVYLSGLLQDSDLFATLAITFSFVSLFFVAVSVKKSNRDQNKPAPKVNMANVIGLNIATAGSWVGFFAALKYIEPAVVSALANAVGPLLTLFVTVYVLRSDKITKGQAIAAVGVLLFMGLIINSTISKTETMTSIGVDTSLLGVLMALLCGLSMVMNTIFSKRLNNQGVQPHQIMTFRFVLIIIIGAAVAGFDVVYQTLQNYWLALLLVAILGNVIPLYLLQIGISKTPPLIVSNCLVVAPLFYFVSQQFSDRISFSLETLLYICGSLVCIAIGVIAKSKAVESTSASPDSAQLAKS